MYTIYILQERVCTKVQYITLCVHVLVHCVHSQVSVVVYTMHTLDYTGCTQKEGIEVLTFNTTVGVKVQSK